MPPKTSPEPEASPEATALESIFGHGGTLAARLPGFHFRPQQLAMAEAVARAIAERGQLVAEAGTGTGKTFAYLVPALLYGGKVIVSTGTKTLQDQLYERDIPLLRDALAVPVTIAVLKGRANYVCHHHLERTAREGRLPSREDARLLPKIVAFARASERGDRAELADVPENASIWPLVTSTRDNCLGQHCAFHKECFVLKARKDALDADVVVVNHHLFFADVMLRDEGLAELLPACNTVILDEAHQLPDTATLFFGEQTGAGQLAELARDAEIAARTAARDVPELPDAAADLVPTIRKVRLAAGDVSGKFTQQAIAAREGFQPALDALSAALDRLVAEMKHFAERSEDLASIARRAEEAAVRIARWRAGLIGTPPEDGVEWIRWIDVTPQGWQLQASPLSIADIFRRQVESTARAWIFTSATLAVGSDFTHYTGQLGLADAATGAWDSPFDYDRQALLYVPRDLPPPNTREHTDAVVDAALPLLKASGGRAFLLFTTLRALAAARERIAAAFAREGLDYPLLVQGEGSKSELLMRFRALGNAVLLGSASFWEGVDVPGNALSLVVIDKLPFAPPDDPLLAARLTKLRDEGGNPFIDWQLPQAAISLKQGAGRLIRTETDRGVLMICDPRLTDKPYGRRIWQSLPPMRRTRDEAEAVAFFRMTEPVPETAVDAAG
ncbi:MAG TPA: ATP-dependent DNA helicase [Casimicrobiaceae bacterium]